MAHIMLDRVGRSCYAKLRYNNHKSKRLGVVPLDSPTPLLDVSLRAAGKYDDPEILIGLRDADKSEREEDRKPGRPARKKRGK